MRADSMQVVGFWKIFGRFSTCEDSALLVFGVLLSIILGMALPVFCLLFGQILDAMGGHKVKADNYGAIERYATYLGILGAAVYIVGAAQ